MKQEKKKEGNTKGKGQLKKVNVKEKGKGILVNEEEADKPKCPWVLYISKGDKNKWLVRTFKEEHKCLQIIGSISSLALTVVSPSSLVDKNEG